MLKKSFFKIKSTCETLGKLSSVGAPESRELRPLSWSLNVLIIMGGGGGERKLVKIISNAILGTENSIYFQMGSRGWLTPELPKFTDRPVQSVFCITDIQLELFKARRPASLVYLFINCPWCILHHRYSIRFFWQIY